MPTKPGPTSRLGPGTPDCQAAGDIGCYGDGTPATGQSGGIFSSLAPFLFLGLLGFCMLRYYRRAQGYNARDGAGGWGGRGDPQQEGIGLVGTCLPTGSRRARNFVNDVQVSGGMQCCCFPRHARTHVAAALDPAGAGLLVAAARTRRCPLCWRRPRLSQVTPSHAAPPPSCRRAEARAPLDSRLATAPARMTTTCCEPCVAGQPGANWAHTEGRCPFRFGLHGPARNTRSIEHLSATLPGCLLGCARCSSRYFFLELCSSSCVP